MTIALTGPGSVAGCEYRHFQQRNQLLPARLMQRLVALICAILLMLSLSTGTSAHAEQRFDCMPVTTETTAHFDGDRDESPSKNEKGAAHHHSGCGGHHFGSPSNVDDPDFADSAQTLTGGAIAAFRPGTSPDSQLRPPIA